MKFVCVVLSLFMMCVFMSKSSMAGPVPTVPTAPPTPPSGIANSTPYDGPPTLPTKSTTPQHSSPKVHTVTNIYPTTTPKRRG